VLKIHQETDNYDNEHHVDENGKCQIWHDKIIQQSNQWLVQECFIKSDAIIQSKPVDQ